MLDLAYVRANLDEVRRRLATRGADPNAFLSDFESLDESRRNAITEAEKLQATRNALSAQVGHNKKHGLPVDLILANLADIKATIAEREGHAAELDDRMRSALAGIPNLPQESVPSANPSTTTASRRFGTARKSPKATLRRTSPSPPSRTGRSANTSASSTSSAPPRSPARASSSTSARERGWSARWPTSCSTCTHASTATPKSSRPTWSTRSRSSEPASSPSSPRTSSTATTRARTNLASFRTPTTGSSPPPRSPSPISSATRRSTSRSSPSASAPTRPASAPKREATARTCAE